MYLSIMLCVAWADNITVDPQLDAHIQEIKTTYKNVEYLEATFVQISNQMGMQLEQTGKVFLAKPKNIRWEFQTPSEQLILSDGKELWVYTPAANQAILSEDMSQSNPIAGLIDNLSEIDSYFSLQIIDTPQNVLDQLHKDAMSKNSKGMEDKNDKKELKEEFKEDKRELKEDFKEDKRELKEQKKDAKGKGTLDEAEGQNNNLEKDIKTKKRREKGIISFEITPTDETLAANVKQLVLTLDTFSYEVRSILIYDPMDGMVHLVLSDMKIEHGQSKEISNTQKEQRNNLFIFTPPEGTNVIKSNSFAP